MLCKIKQLSNLLFFVTPRQGTHHFTSHWHHRFTSSLQSIHKDLECIRLVPPFHRELFDFYGDNFSSQRNKRVVPSLPKEDVLDDVVYVLRKATVQPEHEIVASLRLTRSKSDERYIFLRSLCCAKEYRRQGLGVHLLQSSLNSFNTTSGCYCFASTELAQFYEKAGFKRIQTTTGINIVPKWMIHSYTLMADKWDQKGKTLELFVKPPVQKAVTHIILLQHSEEFGKSTATGWLADDKLYNQFIGELQPSNDSLGRRVQLDRWIWSGRNDTSMIENQIQELVSNDSSVFLLWTGQSSNTTSDAISNKSYYIILDGTWQQAQTMYRKIPSLWKLPQIWLANTQPSKYTLRKDYTGWREKFSSNEDGGDLLCTAEVIAAVLDRRGDGVGADEIRDRLDVFQRYYPQIVEKRKEETD
jgi:DTW domain-containing protein YfiP/predicted GNAT family N-acyltransferase